MKTSINNIAAAIGIILVMSVIQASASDDMFLYSGITSIRSITNLNNGWKIDANSNTINISNTTPVHSGTYSMSVAGSNDIYFEHDPPVNTSLTLDTTIYSNLTFWVYGGSVTGQQYIVHATLEGKAQNNFTYAPLSLPTSGSRPSSR